MFRGRRSILAGAEGTGLRGKGNALIAVDTNLLVYAHRKDSPHHEEAAAVLRQLTQGPAPWGLPWPCVHEFLAVVTHRRIYQPPTKMPLALQAMTAITDLPQVQILGETADHLSILGDLMRTPGVVGPKVHDARIAAICVGHGVSTMWSADRDFSWFSRLSVHNPLAAAKRA